MSSGGPREYQSLRTASRVILKNLLPQEMEALFESWALRPYRARQVIAWIYRHAAGGFEEMSNLSKEDRAFLSSSARIGMLQLADIQRAPDATQKWVFKLDDGLKVESVLIPEAGHWTQCISTQVGCAMGCRFCRTGGIGLKRQLQTWEIVDQVVRARKEFGEGRVRNVVMMGMGEPLANYEAVVRAIRIMLFPEGLDLSRRRITLSTCGMIPELQRIASEGLGIGLAVSLNATTEELRDRLMPVNRIHPLSKLLEACRELPIPRRDRITFEYILFDGVNDSAEDARRLCTILRGIRCKVNLIPHNPFPGSPFAPPPVKRVLEFQRVLNQARLTAPIRWSHGLEINAACGQLAGE